MVSKNAKSSDKQNVELFKFFENTKQRKTSKTSPKSKKDPKPMVFKLPQRRTTRLKSEIFVENYPEFLPDGEYDISKEDFDNSDLTLEPIKKKIKLSDNNDNSKPQINGVQCDALNATSEKTDSTLETTIEHSVLEKFEKRKRKNNSQTSDIQKIADNFLETIDTNAIAEMLKDTSLDKNDCENTKISKGKRKGAQSENSEQHIESSQSDSALQPENNVTKISQNQGENFDLVDNQKSMKKSKKSKKKKGKSLQTNTKLENEFYDSDPQLPLTISEDDGNLEQGKRSDLEDTEKSAEVTKKSKKKKRKSLQTSTQLKNGFYDNNPQLILTISDDDGDLEQFSNKELKDSNIENEESTQEFKKSKSKKKKHKLNLDNNDNTELSTILTDNDDGMKKSPEISLQVNSNVVELKDSNINESKKSKSKQHKLNLENSDNNPDLSLIVSDNDEELDISPNISILANKYDTNSNAEKLNDSNVENEQSSNKADTSTSNLSNNIDNENDDDNNLEKSVNSIQPKERGRKPKALNNCENNSLEKSENSEEPKKRGRKPKALNNCDNNNLKKSANSVEPKKRGRKPKILNNSLSDKSTSNGILKYFRQKNTKSDENKNLLNENSESPMDNTLNDNNTPTDSAIMSTQKITRRSNNINTTDVSLANTKLNKTGNSDEVPRQNAKPRVIKVNVAKEYIRKKTHKISKMTKEQIKNSTSRKIPKQRLEEVLEMIDDEDHPMWEDRNISCNPCIYAYWESRHIKPSEQNMKLRYARQFLLRRDWTNLSKILCLYNLESKSYYPLLSKYAALLLAHTDSENFDKFIKFLTSMTDSSAVIKKCTMISKENEE